MEFLLVKRAMLEDPDCAIRQVNQKAHWKTIAVAQKAKSAQAGKALIRNEDKRLTSLKRSSSLVVQG